MSEAALLTDNLVDNLIELLEKKMISIGIHTNHDYLKLVIISDNFMKLLLNKLN